jgi:predicted MFS family arabinose efflux permease
MTLVMAIACGVVAANIYYNQPMLGIMEAAFPGQITVIGLVPTATQLGFAAGLLLLVPLGDRFDRRRLILIQFAALTLSLAAAALAPDAWSLVVASALVGGASSVAQQIVPLAAELTDPSRRGATIGTVMSGLFCGILFGRVLADAVARAGCASFRYAPFRTACALASRTARKRYGVMDFRQKFLAVGNSLEADD